MIIPGVKDKLLIVDLEATCWENKGMFHEMETIEIGAVLVDLKSRDAAREFDCFIRPVRNRILSDFCKSLTSIKQEDVDAAEPLDALGEPQTQEVR